ncbi:hypothetical protein V6N13_021408 [Hibiscus sabdariffa]
MKEKEEEMKGGVESGGKKTNGCDPSGVHASVNADTDGQNEDSEEDKEDESVDNNGFDIGLKVTELESSVVPRKLEEEAGGEQDEEQQPYNNGRPILHCYTCKLIYDLLQTLSVKTTNTRNAFKQCTSA